jgi:hypothetical protein
MAHIFNWRAVDEVAERCLADVDQWTRSQRAVTA